jgi:hypothetical protein
MGMKLGELELVEVTDQALLVVAEGELTRELLAHWLEARAQIQT